MAGIKENSDTIFEFEKIDKESLKKNHGGKIHQQLLDCAFEFIEEKSKSNIKGNFELIILKDNGEDIRLISGKKEHKFLATYDSDGNPKIRRCVGSAKMKPDKNPFKVWSLKEKYTETPYKMMAEILKTENKKAAIGLLCMRIAKFLENSGEEDIICTSEIAFYGDDDRLFLITTERRENIFLATFDNKGNPMIAKFTGEAYSFAESNADFVFKCGEINKKKIGKMIIQVCGNEGTEDDDNSAKARKIFQGISDCLDKKKITIWKNAEIKTYDKNYDEWKIRSGEGHYKFVANIDGDGEVKVSPVPKR